MAERPDVIIAGHSHMFALGARQCHKGHIQLEPVPGTDRLYFLMAEWTGNRSPSYWDALVNYSRNRIVVLLYNGNKHNADFLLAHGPRSISGTNGPAQRCYRTRPSSRD
jgi:hypothetical protein